MDDRHVMRLIKATEKIAESLNRIAATLDKMHAADPMAMIQQAVAAEAGKEPAADPLAHIPESERYRFQ
jgi:hypothetical protein